MKQTILSILLALAAAVVAFGVLSPAAEAVGRPYYVFYEENGGTLREYCAKRGENYYPFSVLYLGGISEESYTEYMSAAKKGDPFSVDITFSGEKGKLYLYNTCSLKSGKLVNDYGGYTDGNYTMQVCATLEPFPKDGEMLYAFTLYSETTDKDIAGYVALARSIIAAADSCTVDVYSGDNLTDKYGHTGEYTGVPFSAELTTDLSALDIPKLPDVQYKGKAVKPTVTVRDVGCTLKKGRDYTVSYMDNSDVGTATVTITGVGRYSGSVTRTFRLLPRKCALKASVSGGKVKLKWRNYGDSDCYLVYCSTDGGATFRRVGKVSGEKSSCRLKLPEGGSALYKIRSLRTVGGKKYYSEWSEPVGTDLPKK
ncbi:MAG: hypothetical protein IK093_17805 [Ruminiclostridium sp.]|nr:hypothetical protein [Ruminiclostridium sp.]